MTGVLLLAVIILGVLLMDTRRRLDRLERQAAQAAAKPPANAGQASDAIPPAPAPVAAETAIVPVAPERARQGPGRRARRAPTTLRFEDVVGKRLPIWIGGIALACAAFFLVRYSIELGLFGPRARSLLAALFGTGLLVLAEQGRRLPRIGRSFAADPRLAQSLAGAGIATLYGTLYMAAELYGLIGFVPGFALVVALTALALYLSQRHGPPTALLGLAGGYLAPYVAGLPDTSLTATIVYLATFGAGLLALALLRGWTWLAWSMSGASLVWTISLLAVADAGERHAVGLLIVAAGVAASAVLAGDRTRFAPLPVAVPLAAGALQLAVLTALADFSPLAWVLLFALAAAALVLARRHRDMLPGVWASLVISAAAVAGSLIGKAPSANLLLPPLAFTALIGGAGQAFAFRPPEGRQWARLGALAPAVMLAACALYGAPGQQAIGWGLACLAAAAPAIVIVLRAERTGDGETADLGLAVAAACAVGATGFLLPPPLYPLGYAGLYLAAAWSRRTTRPPSRELAWTILTLLALAMLLAAGPLPEIPFHALTGRHAHFQDIPRLGQLLLALAMPGAAILAAGSRWGRGDTGFSPVAVVGGTALGAFAYALAKQPLAIAGEAGFLRWGFVERAAITQALAASGWLLLRGARWRSPRWTLGAVALGLAVLRVAWFDLLLLNPVVVDQAVLGPPLLNAGTLHATGMAIWLWASARQAGALDWPKPSALALALGSFALAIVAVLVTVRQGVHGPLLAGAGVTRAENYFYSAGLLLLALAWLASGIRRAVPLVRIAGLALLTVVTLKVFLVDAASLRGLLRVLSFLGLGAALIGIGWAYSRAMPSSSTA